MAVVMRGIVILFVWWFHRSLGDASVQLGAWAKTEDEIRAKTFLNIVLLPCIFDAVQVDAFEPAPGLRRAGSRPPIDPPFHPQVNLLCLPPPSQSAVSARFHGSISTRSPFGHFPVLSPPSSPFSWGAQVAVQSFALKPAASFVQSEKLRAKLKQEAVARAESRDPRPFDISPHGSSSSLGRG